MLVCLLFVVVIIDFGFVPPNVNDGLNSQETKRDDGVVEANSLRCPSSIQHGHY